MGKSTIAKSEIREETSPVKGEKLVFTCTKRDIRALLTSGYYRVPRFQRPYSWTREELEDFWQDTIVEGDADYFIGSVVAFIDGPGSYGLVDGQQRLTTITMLLCCIRNAFKQENNNDLATGLHSLVIERPNVESLPQYVLQPETSAPYFQEHVQKPEDPEVNVELGDEEKDLRSARQYLADQVDAAIDGIRSDSTLSDAQRSEATREQLAKIRDKLLALSLIFVELDDEDNACLVFGFFTDLSTAPEAAESARDRGQSELVAPWPTSVSAAASVHRACLARGEGRP